MYAIKNTILYSTNKLFLNLSKFLMVLLILVVQIWDTLSPLLPK